MCDADIRPQKVFLFESLDDRDNPYYPAYKLPKLSAYEKYYRLGIEQIKTADVQDGFGAPGEWKL